MKKTKILASLLAGAMMIGILPGVISTDVNAGYSFGFEEKTITFDEVTKVEEKEITWKVLGPSDWEYYEYTVEVIYIPNGSYATGYSVGDWGAVEGNDVLRHDHFGFSPINENNKDLYDNSTFEEIFKNGATAFQDEKSGLFSFLYIKNDEGVPTHIISSDSFTIPGTVVGSYVPTEVEEEPTLIPLLEIGTFEISYNRNVITQGGEVGVLDTASAFEFIIKNNHDTTKEVLSAVVIENDSATEVYFLNYSIEAGKEVLEFITCQSSYSSLKDDLLNIAIIDFNTSEEMEEFKAEYCVIGEHFLSENYTIPGGMSTLLGE